MALDEARRPLGDACDLPDQPRSTPVRARPGLGDESRGASFVAGGAAGTPGRSGLRPSFPRGLGPPRRNAVAQDADPFDLELHLVAGSQPALIAVLEDAAGADAARADDVARPKLGVARRALDDLVPRPVHVAEVAPGALLAVHPRDHLQAKVAELVRGDED